MEIKDKSKEEIILKAAEVEFMLKGFHGAKTTSIAKEAGVTHAMLHYYYRTKENLFNKVFETKVSLISDIIVRSFANSDMPLLERVKLTIESHFNFLVENQEQPRFLINELISQPDRRKIFENKIEDVIGIVIPALQKELDDEVLKGNIRAIKAFDLILDIVSLNVFVFVVFPIITSFDSLSGNTSDFFENRKQENVELIMRRLKK